MTSRRAALLLPGGGTVPPGGLRAKAVAYWRLDESSDGTGAVTRKDWTLRGNDLTDNNTVPSTAGKIVRAGLFTSANSEYLSRADNADLSMGDVDFTLAGWVYLASKTAEMTCLGKDGGGTNREYSVRYDNTQDRFRFYATPDGTGASVKNAQADTFGSPSTATWYFLIAEHDHTNDTLKISVNNGTANSAAITGGVFDGTAEFDLGRLSSAGSYWNGRLDGWGVYKSLLTAQEKAWLYNGGAGHALF